MIFSKLLKSFLIHIFHFVGDDLGGASGGLVLDEVWHLLIDLVVLNAETELDHSVDSEVNKEVSNNSQMRSLTVLSFLSASLFFFNSTTMGWLGLSSMVFFGDHVGGH